jgi:septal ring factor EnvC (AmiA/AmiB activator)
LVELEAAARALEETLQTLGSSPGRTRAKRDGVSFSSRKGKLEPPVSGSIVRSFGEVVDAQFRTKTFRKGVDFSADSGTPVRAVAAADVRFAGWFRGYGKIVILDHAERFFTISGHLDSIDVAVGDQVEEGGRVGSVGETGSLSGPRLYFEIRQGSEALDPVEWFAR